MCVCINLCKFINYRVQRRRYLDLIRRRNVELPVVRSDPVLRENGFNEVIEGGEL